MKLSELIEDINFMIYTWGDGEVYLEPNSDYPNIKLKPVVHILEQKENENGKKVTTYEIYSML